MNSLKSLRPLAVAASLAAVLLAGCRITHDKNGKNDNVDISTPFGSMQVKTNGNVDALGIGIRAYPGAVEVKGDGDNSAADVNMNFGSFHLGVKAASYQTGDSQDEVMAFYRKELARYGDVIECKDNEPVGTPTHTSQGLTCDEHHDNYTAHSGSGLELRSGSEQHQHIVAIESKNGGTRIGLVMLSLPSQVHSHDDDNKTE